jgi:hypothetical protein
MISEGVRGGARSECACSDARSDGAMSEGASDWEAKCHDGHGRKGGEGHARARRRRHERTRRDGLTHARGGGDKRMCVDQVQRGREDGGVVGVDGVEGLDGVEGRQGLGGEVGRRALSCCVRRWRLQHHINQVTNDK